MHSIAGNQEVPPLHRRSPLQSNHGPYCSEMVTQPQRAIRNTGQVVPEDGTMGLWYFLVFWDLITRWVELKPVKSGNWNTVSKAFEELILFWRETPDYVLTDNGTEFDNNRSKNTLKGYRTRYLTRPRYHAQDDTAECRNRMLKNIIFIFVELNHQTSGHTYMNSGMRSIPLYNRRYRSPQLF